MSLRRYRKKRRPGNRPMTKAESARVERAKELGCVACLVLYGMGRLHESLVIRLCEYNHTKSGNIRRGHDKGYALCQWHHKGYPWRELTVPETRAIYGPSLVDGSKTFHETYGSDDELIELQTEILARAA